jgi:hypothetical protein
MPTEPKDHECPCCLQAVTKSEHARVTALLAAAATTHANGFEWCRECGGPVEKGREVYARPTCYRCLPPPSIKGFAPPPDPPVYATLADRDDWRRRLAEGVA